VKILPPEGGWNWSWTGLVSQTRPADAEGNAYLAILGARSCTKWASMGSRSVWFEGNRRSAG